MYEKEQKKIRRASILHIYINNAESGDNFIKIKVCCNLILIIIQNILAHNLIRYFDRHF